MRRPKILYLTHRVPYPPNRGDRIRTYNVLRFLAGWADVSLASLSDETPCDESRSTLARWCRRLAIVPVDRCLRWGRAAWSYVRGRSLTEGIFESPRLRAVVREWCRDERFDAVLASSSGLAPYLREPARRGTATFVDLIDVDSQKWFDYAARGRGPRRVVHRLEGERLRAWERDLAGWTRGTFVVSAAEAQLYRSFCPSANVHAVPNGVDTDHFQPTGSPEEIACAFVGALDYPPNVDGACWFAREVWPEVRRRRPAAVLRLVGREPVRTVRDLAALPGVEVAANVPDVRPHLAQASVVVVPLRIARGVQNKILEALAMRKAVVTSKAPLAGLGVRAGVHLATAESVAEWTDRILGLLDDPASRAELGFAGMAYVLAHHRWERCLEPLRDVLLRGVRRDRVAPGVAARPEDVGVP